MIMFFRSDVSTMPLIIDAYGESTAIALQTGKRLSEVVAPENIDEAVAALQSQGEYFVPGGALVLRPAACAVAAAAE